MANNETFYHTPVLLQESIDGLITREDGVYADVTFGGGGHSRSILERLSPEGRLFAFDQDRDSKDRIPSDHRFTFIQANFRFLKRYLRLYGIKTVDGILADLGVSSHQFDTPERGFSFRFDAPLDLRMDTSQDFKASDILLQYSFEELKFIFKEYGELKHASKIAEILVEHRESQPITSTLALKNILQHLASPGAEHKFFAQLFQALRIEVNHEMDSLKEMLSQTTEMLSPGGRLVVISYHSLEDRLVKRFMKSGNCEGNVEKDFYGNVLTPFEPVTRKPIVPCKEEMETNPRSRSGKLRIVAKKGGES